MTSTATPATTSASTSLVGSYGVELRSPIRDAAVAKDVDKRLAGKDGSVHATGQRATVISEPIWSSANVFALVVESMCMNVPWSEGCNAVGETWQVLKDRLFPDHCVTRKVTEEV